MTLDSVLGYLCLAYDRGLCRSAAAERDILIFICSSRSGEGGSSLGSDGGVTSLSGEGRGGRSGTSFCFSSVAVSFDDGSGREEQSRLSLSTTSRTLFLLADFSLMGLAGGDGHLAGVWGGSDSSAARALLLVGVRGPTSVAALGGVVATTMREMFSSYTGVGDVRGGLFGGVAAREDLSVLLRRCRRLMDLIRSSLRWGSSISRRTMVPAMATRSLCVKV